MRRVATTPFGWTTGTIASRLSSVFPGEWGSDPTPGKEVASVLRSTNLDDFGHVDLGTGADRHIPQIKLATKELRPGDILLEASGGGPGKPVGRVALFKGGTRRHICSNFFRTLRPNSQIHSGYLAWRLLHLYESPGIWNYQQQTTGLINLNLRDYLDQDLAWPPLAEQAHISEVLDTLDEAIRATQDGLLKQGAIYLGLQEKFFTPSGIRARQGWQEARLEDIADSITSGPRGWATYYADEGDYFLRIGNLTRKHLDLRFDDVVKVQPPTGAEGVRTALAPGDLLISITADLGIIGVVPDWMGVAYINQHIARARVDRTRVNPRFLGYQLAGLIGQKQFYRLNDVGAKAGLNLPAVGGLKAWLPPMAEQDRIASTLDSVQQALRREEAILSKLKSLKAGLSSDLLTGRVRVPA